MAKKKQQKKGRVDRYSVLLAVSDIVHGEVELKILLHKLLDRITDVLDAERATIYFVDAKRKEIFSQVAHLPEMKEIRLKIGQGVAGFVAKTGQVVTLPNSRFDTRFYANIDAKTGYTTRSMITVPVKDKQQAIFALVQVLNKKNAVFDPSDEAFMQSVAAQLGIILEHTSLYTQIRQKRHRETIEIKDRFNHIVGESAPMKDLFKQVSKAARTDATVLIRGESGVGKELIAKAVHYNSRRTRRPLVKIDCASMPASLLENELFGHAKGAYTGAQSAYEGKFIKADGGTVFIDEIGELPLALQPKLLRILQDREFEPLGGNRTLRADIRILSATNRNLEEMVARGLFREDLYYRIKVIQLDVPPLRERRGDVVALARFFLHLFGQKHARPAVNLSPATLKALDAYRWPGNVRELQNCIESALVLCDSASIEPADLNLPHRRKNRSGSALRHLSEEADELTLEQMKRAYATKILEKYNGNRTRAANALGIGRNTLLRLIADE